jgi:hypothetical protein
MVRVEGDVVEGEGGKEGEREDGCSPRRFLE